MNPNLKALFDDFEQRHGMPMDKPFLDKTNFLYHQEPDGKHMLNAWHPEHGPVGSIQWDDDAKTVDMIYVDPAHRHKGLASELWNRAKKAEPDLKHSWEMTPEGRDWAISLGPEDKAHAERVDEMSMTASQTRTCVLCKNIFDESEAGEATGFCGSCREKEGLVTHNSWSQDAQEGHYGKTNKADKRAIMSIGIPGSGKSTILKPYAEALGAPYISTDETRGEVAGDPADVSKDAVVWPLVYQRLHEALDEHDTVVFDSTAANYDKRKDVIRHLRQKAGTVIGIHFDVPLEVAHQRNEDRERRVPTDVIDSMHAQLQEHPPGDEFDHIETIGGGQIGDSGSETPPDRTSSVRLATKRDFMRTLGAFQECRFCLGTGSNGGRRCGKCAATGSEGTVPCGSCGQPLRAYEVFIGKEGTHQRVQWPSCERCLTAPSGISV